jgi:glutamine synthetase
MFTTTFETRTEPLGDPLDKDIYALSPEELKNVGCVPASLDEALDALEQDHEYLLKGDVFTSDLIETRLTAWPPRSRRSR